jgi:hypothetical protein
MKKLLLFLLLTAGSFVTILIVAAPAHASSFGRGWTWTNTGMEALDIGLMAIDYKQTRCFTNPKCSGPGFYENGPARLVVGKHPNKKRLLGSAVGYAAAHAFISAWLSPARRKNFQSLTSMGRFYFVMGNHQAGIKTKW